MKREDVFCQQTDDTCATKAREYFQELRGNVSKERDRATELIKRYNYAATRPFLLPKGLNANSMEFNCALSNKFHVYNAAGHISVVKFRET